MSVGSKVEHYGPPEEVDGQSSESTTSFDPAEFSVKRYKYTLEDALAHKPLPLYRMFDLDTGLIKEKYKRMRSPPPPSSTTVYEVGTGCRFKFTSGTEINVMPLDSVLLDMTRREAVQAGVWRPTASTAVSRSSDMAHQSVSRGSGLRRVIPLPTQQPLESASPSGLSTEIDPRMVAQIRRATEKVLRWHTETPEPVEDVPPLYREVSERPDHVGMDMCHCVSLVSSGVTKIEMKAPHLSSTDDQDLDVISKQMLVCSPTLRFLREGYRNYVENGFAGEVHRLSAYCCHSPRYKLFNAYKRIDCRRRSEGDCPVRHGGEGSSSQSPSVSFYQTVFDIINQYMHVFSILADFNYRLTICQASEIAINALVVDKRWLYNSVRQVYVPYYKLLACDIYTDIFVKDIRTVKKEEVPIKHLRFISTPHTRLYTNDLSLSRGVKGKHRSTVETEGCTIIDQSTSRPDLPFKKRRLDHTSVSKPIETSASEPTAQAAQRKTPLSGAPSSGHVLRTGNGPTIQHRRGCPEVAKDFGPSTSCRKSPTHPRVEPHTSQEGTAIDDPMCTSTNMELKNPTLIIFKQSMYKNEPDALHCDIIVELHLGREIVY